MKNNVEKKVVTGIVYPTQSGITNSDSLFSMYVKLYESNQQKEKDVKTVKVFSKHKESLENFSGRLSKNDKTPAFIAGALEYKATEKAWTDKSGVQHPEKEVTRYTCFLQDLIELKGFDKAEGREEIKKKEGSLEVVKKNLEERNISKESIQALFSGEKLSDSSIAKFVSCKDAEYMAKRTTYEQQKGKETDKTAEVKKEEELILTSAMGEDVPF